MPSLENFVSPILATVPLHAMLSPFLKHFNTVLRKCAAVFIFELHIDHLFPLPHASFYHPHFYMANSTLLQIFQPLENHWLPVGLISFYLLSSLSFHSSELLFKLSADDQHYTFSLYSHCQIESLTYSKCSQMVVDGVVKSRDRAYICILIKFPQFQKLKTLLLLNTDV